MIFNFGLLHSVTLAVSIVSLLIYYYFKRKHSYWSDREAPFIEPSIPFGNIGDVILRKTSILQLLRKMYVHTKGQRRKYIGIYLCARKGLFVADPSLIKKILSTDFQHFHDRDLYYDEKNDPLSANLVALNGQKWKNLRTKLTPTFTTGKLKMMFQIVFDCANEMTLLLQDTDSPIEIKDILARFATDVIGSCAFGIDCDSLKNPETEFRQYGKRALKQSPVDTFKLVIYKNFPSLARLMKLSVVNAKVTNFFMDVVEQTINYREQHNVIRKDFLQLLIQLKNKGTLDEDDDNQTEATKNNKNNEADTALTLNEIAAQAFVFFLAGFETSSTVLSFALFEISLDDDIQETLRQEIRQSMKQYNGNLTYEGIMEMQYMDKVVQETMRKYPPVPVLLRKCTENYNIPDTNLTIEKGTPVFISVWGLHEDPEFYPEPDKFDPERFSKLNIQMRPDYTYLPFGDGPRICIGLRFGMMQVKIALAHLLNNFKFSLNAKTKVPLTFGIDQVVLNPVGGIWLNVTKLKE